MRTICLEGPSAVGKSSLARVLAADVGSVVVPEVNLLFTRPADPEPNWYLERQKDRWDRACGPAPGASLAILDGDVLQPLWYGWAYGFVDGYSLYDLVGFYRPLIASGALAFPDTYFMLHCSTEELRARQKADPTRQRRNFERHLQFIEPQREYFRALQALAPGLVNWMPASTVSGHAQGLQRALASTERRDKSDDLEIFDKMAGFLERGFARVKP